MPSKFRQSFTQVAGHEPARIVQGSVVNINLKTWTVDVVAQFDRKKYFNVQVGSPYLHHSNGEGMTVFPEVAATCMVCIPSDSAAPFILAFVMAPETVNGATADAPSGTASHAQMPANATSSTFVGGRPQAKPGDLWFRTRDDNFVILHRGGVLQLGATELAQRIYIPLNNLITDISENYEHHNSNGSIVWGLQQGASKTLIPSQYLQTFRVFASDQYADVKMAWGKVASPVPEPDGGVTLAQAGVAQGDDGKGSNPIIFEVTVSPKGFVTESGAIVNKATVTNSVLKFTFDRTGNGLLRMQGNLLFQIAKELTLLVQGAISVSTQASADMTAVSGFDIDGGAYAHIKGNLVRLGAGTTAVARQGDPITLLMSALPAIITFPSTPAGGPTPCTISASPAYGFISGGNPSVLA